MIAKEILNETVNEINKKQGKDTITTANKITPINVKTPTEMSGENNNYCLSSEMSITCNNNYCQVRNLKKEEIECKIAMVKEGKGLSLLLYKTARTDILILDETFGKMNWQCEYKEIKGNMYCGISVFDKIKSQWVTKWDCGVESVFGDKQKGEASDSFKRAGFKWGIGIELYTAPFIWISSNKCEIKNGKCCDKFIVSKIAIEEKEIVGLAIRNTSKNNERVFVWQAEGKKYVK